MNLSAVLFLKIFNFKTIAICGFIRLNNFLLNLGFMFTQSIAIIFKRKVFIPYKVKISEVVDVYIVKEFEPMHLPLRYFMHFRLTS